MTVAPPPVLVITGFAAEARVAEGAGVVVANMGGSPERLRTMLDRNPARAYRAVISFGIAGGLDPNLPTGTAVAATAVVSADQRWPTHKDVASHWAKQLAESGAPAVAADLAGADTQISTRADKDALRRRTGAAAVDMESHIVARFAATQGLPFAALRVVCDPAWRALPPLTVDALRPDGGINVPAIFRSLMRQPWQIATLPGLVHDAATAFSSLRRVRATLGPGFGLGRLGLGEPLGDIL